MTDQTTPAPRGDRLFALIASIPGSGSVDWCDRVRALLDEVRAEAAAARAQHVTRAVFALKNPPPPGSEHYRAGWDDGLDAAIDAARAAFEVALASEPDAKADSKPAADPVMEAPTITPVPDRDGVILHLPEITYLDTQVWAADVGLTRKALAALAAVLPASVDRTDEEADAETVANRAAQVISTMGAEIRELRGQRDRYRTAWHSARKRASVLSAELTRRAPLLAEHAAEIEKLVRWHREDGTALAEMRATIVRLREELAAAAELRRAAGEVGTASARSLERDGAEFKVAASSLNSDGPSGMADEAHKERKAQTRIETEATDALARVRAIAERAASNVQRPAARLARRILAELPGQNACPPRCPCHPDRPAAEPPPVHLGGGANAELCPACRTGQPLPWPFLCTAAPGAAVSSAGVAPQPKDTDQGAEQ